MSSLGMLSITRSRMGTASRSPRSANILIASRDCSSPDALQSSSVSSASVQSLSASIDSRLWGSGSPSWISASLAALRTPASQSRSASNNSLIARLSPRLPKALAAAFCSYVLPWVRRIIHASNPGVALSSLSARSRFQLHPAVFVIQRVHQYFSGARPAQLDELLKRLTAQVSVLV